MCESAVVVEKSSVLAEESWLGELELVRRGPEQMAELFESYRARLERMIHFRLDARLLGRVDPDDILQESFLDISRRRSDYLLEPAVPPFVWMRRICFQILINHHRVHLLAARRSVGKEARLAGPRPGSACLASRLMGDLTSPSQAAVRDELGDVLRAALDQLNEIDREVLVLRHLEELSNQEVASVLGLDRFAASKRYLRALKRLRIAVQGKL